MRPDESFVAQSVRSLQQMLRTLANGDTRLPVVIPDGIFGKQTQHAVSSFQRIYGFPVTGVADGNTWERIAREYESARTTTHPAEPLQIILNPGKIIRRGDSGYNVFILQAILLALAEVYSSMVAPDMTGILDAQTAESVIAFQYLSALPQTGEVDKVTWKHLALHYPLAVNHIESENITRKYKENK